MCLVSQDIIYVADEVRDIEAARKAGVKIICVSWGYNDKSSLEKNNPDALVDNTDQLFAVIKQGL